MRVRVREDSGWGAELGWGLGGLRVGAVEVPVDWVRCKQDSDGGLDSSLEGIAEWHR